MKVKIINVIFIIIMLCVALSFISCKEEGHAGSSDAVVTYYLNENSAPIIASVYEGEFRLSVIPQKEHYTFLGLFNDKQEKIVNEQGKCNGLIEKSITLWAKWAPKTCMVEFDFNGGVIIDGAESIKIVYGENISNMPNTQMEGYTFIGWYDGDNKISDTNKILAEKEILNSINYNVDKDEKVKLTARFEKKKYILTLDYNDGSGAVENITVSHGDVLSDIALPKKDTGSSMLVDWSLSKNQIVSLAKTITSDMTLYAIWKDYKKFKFYSSEDAFYEKKVFCGEEYTIPQPNEKVGYIFKGWYSSTDYLGSAINSVSGDTTIQTYYAKYNPISYKISFITNGADEKLKEKSYNIESEVTLPIINKSHCSFVGWTEDENLSGNCLSVIPKGTIGDIVLYAKWRGDLINVSLDCNGGYLNETKTIVEYSTRCSLEIPEYEGYAFQGWYYNDCKMTDKDGVGLDIWLNAEEITLKASWLKKYYVSVSYSRQGAGKVDVNDYYVEDEEVNLVMQTIDDGFNFIGYYKNDIMLTSDKEYSFYMPTEDVDFVIKFVAKKFNVAMDSDNGYVNKKSVTVEYFQDYELPIAYKEGFIFDGWYNGKNRVTDANGNGVDLWNIKENVTLKASYKTDSNAANKVFVEDVYGFLSISKEPTKTFIIICDIDMNGQAWKMVDFSGKIIGNGHTVKNLTISSSSGNLGLFNKLSGTISDLNFSKLNVTSTTVAAEVMVGGICAELTSKGELNNITVNGKISGELAHLGGFVGKNAGAIIDCINYASVSGESTENEGDAGGLIGFNNNRGAIESLKNYGKVKGKQRTGGIIANLQDFSTKDFRMNGLYNYGEIESAQNVGGIVGYVYKSGSWMDIYSSTFHASYWENYGTVTGETYVGGIGGYVYIGYHTHAAFEYFKNNEKVEGDSVVGGLFGKCMSDTGDSSVTVSQYAQSGTVIKKGKVVTDLVGASSGQFSI